ncbi:MAG TPA: hypothetical protein DCY55_00410 [Gammaproteobacteria bacterium]|nr:hypothetical protein [Pseudomonadota bacterium]HAY44734.1 hypothetical protein [Gammaproteobacteria bacterium]
MTHQLFVALTDDILYEHPENIDGPLVPYQSGMDCHHWLTIELNPAAEAPVQRRKYLGRAITNLSTKNQSLATH